MRRLAVLLLLACAHTPSAPVKCPDRPACLTAPRCTFDERTRCEVCVCSDPVIERGSEPAPGQAPFPNH
jgi:hypothetical protein